MRPVIIIVSLALALGLSTILPCYAEYKVGLALPSSSQTTEPYLTSDIEQALRIFKQQLKGSLGRRLEEEFKIETPDITFTTIKCAPRDSNCAIETARKFAQSDCVAAIGHTYSGPALAAGKVYDRARMVLISPTASNQRVAQASNRVFSLNYDDEWQGAIIATYIYKILGRSKPAVVFEETDYGRGLKDSFVKQAQFMGFQVGRMAPIHAVTTDDENLSEAFPEDWLDSADALVMLTARFAGAKVFRQVRERRPDIPVMGPDSLLAAPFVEQVNNMVRRLKLPDANLLVASPFFYELAPLKTRRFRRAMEKALFEQNDNGPNTPRADTKNRTIAPYPALFADAALLVTRGLMAGLSKGKRTVEELRQEIFTYLHGIDSPSKAVNGITGRLFFNKAGNTPRNALFGWLEESGFQPAFDQLIRVPEAPWPKEGGHPSKERVAKAQGLPLVNGHKVAPRYVVFASINLYRIDHIDLLSQTFDAEFFLRFKWNRPQDLALSESAIFFWNSLHKSDDQFMPMGRYEDGSVKYQDFRIKGSFLNKYDLRHYPFDAQELTLKMSLPGYSADRILLAVDTVMTGERDDFAIFPSEYTRISGPHHASGTLPLNAALGDPKRKESLPQDHDYSVYEVRFGVARNPFPHFLKLFLPLFLLIGICLSVFWVPKHHFGVRITLVMTSMLSCIVFHMSRITGLPNVGYLTLADSYFVVSYVVMSAAIAANIWVEWLVQKGRESAAETLNSGARYLLTAAAVFTFLTLSAPSIRVWYLKALVGVGVIFSGWLVYEFVRHNPGFSAYSRRFFRSGTSDTGASSDY